MTMRRPDRLQTLALVLLVAVGAAGVAWLATRGGASSSGRGPLFGPAPSSTSVIADQLGKLIALKRTYQELRQSEVKYRGLDIAQVLALTVEEALAFFSGQATVTDRLWVLHKVGLGYLTLGQPAPTLSGGESQRLKIARELAVPSGRRNLYLLDEPTTGLHVDDIGRLVRVLHDLVDQGHTVLVIEHNLDLIEQADWIIDLGPGGGDAGGAIVAEGTPAQVAATAGSVTGRFLAARGEERSRRGRSGTA